MLERVGRAVPEMQGVLRVGDFTTVLLCRFDMPFPSV